MGGGDAVNFTDPFGLCDDGTAWCAFVKGVARQTAAIQTPVAIATAIVTLPLGGGMGMMGKAGLAMGLARSATAATPRVLGSYPQYLQAAEGLGAKAFDVPSSIFSSWSSGAQWAANQKFLDRGIAQGAEFIIASPRNQIREGSFLSKEIGYLLNRGYGWASGGGSLIPK